MGLLKLTPKQHKNRIRKHFIHKQGKSFYNMQAKRTKMKHPFYMENKGIAKIMSHKKYVIYIYNDK